MGSKPFTKANTNWEGAKLLPPALRDARQPITPIADKGSSNANDCEDALEGANSAALG